MQLIKLLFYPVFLALLCMQVQAQKKQWDVKAGESIREVLGDSAIYRYPQFMPGAVYYKDGRFSRAALNFNFLTGEMEFINPLKDTLAIAGESNIKYITIQTDSFYFDKAYIELVHSNAMVKLGKLEIIKLVDVKKEGAFGQMSSTSAITTANTLYNDSRSFYANSQPSKLTENSAGTLQKETFFFIGNKDDFLPAVKKNINKMFSGKTGAIESFIQENKIAFNKENDLVKLVNFLGNITE